MKLTHRQSAAVSILLDMYAEARQPISYRLVAERLGVTPATAYRMLRLTEAKGYVTSAYAPPPHEVSPGRSSVLFAPTDLARTQLEALAGPGAADADWEAFKARVLAALASPEGLADEQSLDDLLAGLEEPGTPLGVAGRMIALLMIGLEESRDEAPERGELVRRIAAGGTRIGLSTLGGLLLGLAWADRAGRTLARRLDPHVERFESALASLSPEQTTDLAGFAGQVAQALSAGRRGHRRRRPARHPRIES